MELREMKLICCWAGFHFDLLWVMGQRPLCAPAFPFSNSPIAFSSAVLLWVCVAHLMCRTLSGLVLHICWGRLQIVCTLSFYFVCTLRARHWPFYLFVGKKIRHPSIGEWLMVPFEYGAVCLSLVFLCLCASLLLNGSLVGTHWGAFSW